MSQERQTSEAYCDRCKRVTTWVYRLEKDSKSLEKPILQCSKCHLKRRMRK